MMHYEEGVVRVLDALKAEIIRELKTDLSQQEYNSLLNYCVGLVDNFKMDLAQGVVYAGE